MKCQVTRCENEHDNCVHSMTRQLYCESCALKINRANPEHPDLISIPRKEKAKRNSKLLAACILIARPSACPVMVPHPDGNQNAPYAIRQARELLATATDDELRELFTGLPPMVVTIQPEVNFKCDVCGLHHHPKCG